MFGKLKIEMAFFQVSVQIKYGELFVIFFSSKELSVGGLVSKFVVAIR